MWRGAVELVELVEPLRTLLSDCPPFLWQQPERTPSTSARTERAKIRLMGFSPKRERILALERDSSKNYFEQMIYCIGHTELYAQYKQDNERNGLPFEKKGKDPNDPDPNYPNGYPGGSVWKTKEEAQKHCPKSYSIFGVLADWDKDTAPSVLDNATWHDLLIDAKIVDL